MVDASRSNDLLEMVDDAHTEVERAAGAVAWARDPSFSHEGLIWLSQQLVSAGVTEYRLLSRDAMALARHFLVEDEADPHQVALLDLF